ncbi:K02A2.6-like [Pimephales promelas]|nr:K02A2.6-like [Pimephales promelas]
MAGLVGQIGPYDETVEQWSSYTERFDYFVKANGIKDEVLVPTFLSVMGCKTYNLLRSLVQPNKPGDSSFKDIVTMLQEHYAPKPLIIAERFRFHKRNQLEGESIAQFVAVLKRLSEHCEFGTTLSDTIRDRFVCGLRSETIQKRLLCESNLTLERAMEIGVSMEMAAKEAQELSTASQVHNVYSERVKQDDKRACYRCGKSSHMAQECWFKDKDCRNCGKKGHIERVCQNRKQNEKTNPAKPGEFKKSYVRKLKKKNVNQVKYSGKQQEDESDETEYSHVMSVSSNSDGYWVTPLLDGKAVPMQVDTGAAVSLMAESTYREKWPYLCLKEAKLSLKTYTGKDDEDHLGNLNATLQRLKEYGLRVKKDKCDFFQPTIEYLGHVIDSAGLHKAPSKVKAIVDALSPKNVSQLRSFLGLLTYYAKFMPNLSSRLRPLHELLNKSNKWKWSDKCEKAFRDVKCTLTQSEVLTHYNPALPIQLGCDASPYGVGAVLSHVMPSGEERPIAFASRTLNSAESNYAQIEREALAIVFGVKKFHQYLFGRRFTLLTDHRPLTSIFGPQTGIPSLAANRMQRWALLLSAHQYDIKYKRSEQHCNADGLSRLPLPDTKPECPQGDIFYFQEVQGAPVTAAQVKRFTRTDPVLSEVLTRISQGWKGKMTDKFKPYLIRRNELTVQSDCLLWGYRVIIPPPLRHRLLKELHAGHSGIVRMKEMARSYFWWPGLDAEIEEEVKGCSECQNVRNMPQPAPLHPWDFPEVPWQRIHIDFAGPLENHMFLVLVDAHSKWPEVAVMHNTSSEKTIEELRNVFSRFGLPQQLVSDNGPQLVSEEFQSFLSVNGIQHIRSAPYHPSTNGLAERFVQTLKKALKTSQGKGSLNQRLNTFLLSYRNTPHATTKVSPATALLKRQLRNRLDLLRPTGTKQIVLSQQQMQVERRSKAKFRSFNRGDEILARNYGKGAKWVPATVLAQTGPVSYIVETKEKFTWRRHVDQLLSSTISSDDPCELDAHQHASLFNSGRKVVSETLPTPSSSEPRVSVPVENTSSSSVTVTDTPVETPPVPVLHRYPTRVRKPPRRLDL